MRIVFDLQEMQGEMRLRLADHPALAFARALVGASTRRGHDVLLLLGDLYPNTIEPIRAHFDNLVPQQNIHVLHTPWPARQGDVNHDWRREVVERICAAFLASLRPDIVHALGAPQALPDDDNADADRDGRADRLLAELEQTAAVANGTAAAESLDALRSRLIESIAAVLPEGEQRPHLASIATAIAADFPAAPGKQIFLDVSAMVQEDAKTGIQRVTRSVLTEFFDSPPEGYAIEPVYATPDSDGYRYARRYTAGFLSRACEGPDEAIEYRSGDIFLGLDLQHRTLIKQRDYLMRLRRDGVKVLTIVYDLLPISMPQNFALEPNLHHKWLEAITDLDGAICISRAVADELMDWLDLHGRHRLRPFRVDWFHLGGDIESSAPSFGMPEGAQAVLGHLARTPGFLMVSTVEPRKGHQQALAAFELLWARGVEAALIVVGKPGWNQAINTLLHDHPQLGKRLFWLRGISDEYLERVYAASTCLLAASEGEGFGLPIVEAAQHKLPIIARDLPVFREIAGEHAFYFSGCEPAQLAAAVENWLALDAQGLAPQSSGIHWQTWVDSAGRLKRILAGHDQYRQWLPKEADREVTISRSDKTIQPAPAPAQPASGPAAAPDPAVAAELNALRQMVAASHAEVAAIKASTSWRMTAPLRNAVTLLRRLARALRPAPPIDTRHTDSAEVALKSHYPLRDAWYDARQPEVSLIVLNFNKPNMTLACLDSLWEHTQGYRYEVVLVDNGSTAENFRKLAPAQAGARVVGIEVNRFFGEGNNLGFEACRGRYVVFLNNDITATADWLQPLIRRLEEDPGIGATGPKMVSPEYRLQEAGSDIRLDGSDGRYGRGGHPDDPAYATQRDVMYISAAALAMRSETFARVLGFDLCYEPAYYEDVDLCMKIRQLNLRVTYCPDSCIVHHENATSADPATRLKLDILIPLNWERFLTRWRPVLTGEAAAVPGLIPPPAAPLRYRPGLPSVLLYTPYNLVPGGGERYLLTIAAGLAEVANVTLATQYPFSRLRLRTMGRELSLDLDAVRIETLHSAAAAADYDVSIVMGNEVLPPIPGQASRNIYICQFPFPAPQQVLDDRRKHADDYQQIVVYSPFARRHYALAVQALNRPLPSITVVSPPAVLAEGAGTSGKRPMVVGVGRFFLGGHTKRQDLMIEAFRALAQVCPEAELHLAGSLTSESEFRAYFADLQRKAHGLRVFFHPNIAPQRLAQLYNEASLYWHLAGYGVDEATDAYRCEHFGITVVEAMSAGCIPLVVNRGGPPQTVQNGVTGYVFESLDELVERSAQLLSRPAGAADIVAMRTAAIEASRRYSPDHFIEEIRQLVIRPTEQPAMPPSQARLSAASC